MTHIAPTATAPALPQPLLALSATSGMLAVLLAWPAAANASRAALWRRWLSCLSVLALLGLAGCQSLPDNTGRPPSQAWATPANTALGQLTAKRHAQDKARTPNGFSLLMEASEAYSARLALIEAAQHTLDLQYYAINLDASASALLSALHDAAKRGVRVRLLLDDFNTSGVNAQVLRLAFVPNIEVRLFNPLPGSRNSLAVRLLGSLPRFASMQQRMHNKLFLADNAVGITGGRNLGDAYFGLGENSNFIDVDVLAHGPVVQQMGLSFDQYWNNPKAYPVERLVSKGELNNALSLEMHASALQEASNNQPVVARDMSEAVREAADVLQQRASQLPPAMQLSQRRLHWVPSEFIVDKPSKISDAPALNESGVEETVIEGMVQLMQAAHKEVLLVTPYFVPGPKIMESFRQMREKGVRVKVLTNSLASNDAVAAHAGYARYRKDLLRLGIELHELRGVAEGADARVRSSAILSGSGSGTRAPQASTTDTPGTHRLSLHAKFVVIDGRLLLIGSMNLDLRSKLQNTEVALVLASRQLAKSITEATLNTIHRASYRVSLDGERLHWQAPAGASFPSATQEPDASAQLRMMATLIAPFAPDELL